MSELNNPIFDEEKEFLERKKLEYERALLGDVTHIKDQTEKVGKIALVGAGLVGGIWLITKAFGGKKRKKRRSRPDDSAYDDGFDTTYFTDGNDQRDESGMPHKPAAASAEVFMHQDWQVDGSDDLPAGSAAPQPTTQSDDSDEPAMASYHVDESDDSEDDMFDEDPFKDLPYDDSRRLPTSHAFDGGSGEDGPARPAASSRSNMVGAVLKSFLQSDTGKVLVGQVAAVALALVTKKVGEFFPSPKNSDLAASPGKDPVEPGTYPVASSASSDSSDALTSSQSL